MSEKEQVLGLIGSVPCSFLNQARWLGKCEAFCYELTEVWPFHPCNSHVEALTPNVVAFRDGGLWERVKFR